MMRVAALFVVALWVGSCHGAGVSRDNLYYASSQQLLSTLSTYRVVTPVAVTPMLQTSEPLAHPPLLRYQLDLFDQVVEVELRKNEGLFSPRYEEIVYRGEEVVSRASRSSDANCHYHGTIVGRPDSAVALTTCDGLYGSLWTEGGPFFIQPLGDEAPSGQSSPTVEPLAMSSGASRRHVLYRVSDLPPRPRRCPTTGVHMEEVRPSTDADSTAADLPPETKLHDLRKSARRFPPASSPLLADSQKYVELLVVNDAAQRRLWGNDTALTNQHAASLINQVSLVYANNSLNPPLQVVMTSMVTFEDSDPYAAHVPRNHNPREVDSYTLLMSFQRWRYSAMHNSEISYNDNAQLLSGYDFDDDVIGLSNMNSMCSLGSSASVNEVRVLQGYWDSITIAHEMGHALGMPHDGDGSNRCDPELFVMASYASAYIPTVFSDCSRSTYQYWMRGQHSSCLNNVA